MASDPRPGKQSPNPNNDAPGVAVSEPAARKGGKSSPAKQDAYVESQLDRARRRIRTLDLLTALLGLLAGVLVFGLVVALLDSSFTLSPLVRGISFGVLIAAAVVYLGITVLVPLTRPINPYYAARKVEETIPDAKNSVVNWLDLHEDERLPGPIQHAVSQKAARDLSRVDLDRAVSGRRAGWAGIVLGVVVLLFLIVWFRQDDRARFFRHLSRAFFPFSGQAVPTSTQLTITEPRGGDATVSADSEVIIRVLIEGRQPSVVRLMTRPTLDDPETPRLMERLANSDEWEARVPPADVRNGFYYRIVGGDAETETHRISVRASPTILQDRFVARYRKRPYSGQKLERIERGKRDLSDLRGTEVKLEVPTNRKLRSGVLEALFADGEKETINAEIRADDPSRMHFKLVLKQNGKYLVRFITTEDETYNDPLLFSIEARPDGAPEVQITKPGMDSALGADEQLTIEGVASDDVGVKELTLRLQIVGGDALEGKRYRSDAEIQLPDGGYPKVLDYLDVLDLAKLRDSLGQPVQLKPNSELEYWLEARDACDFTKPNVAESKRFRIKIVAPQNNPKQKQEQQQQAEKQKQEHQKKQDEKLKQENKQRQEEEKREQERQEKEEKERQQREKNQQGNKGEKGEKNEKGEKGDGKDGKNDPTKQDGQNDTKGGEGADPKKDEKTQEKNERLNQAIKDQEQKDREQRRGSEGKGDPENRGEGKKDPQRDQENRDNPKQDGKQGEAKGKPADQPEPGKEGGKDGEKQQAQPDQKRGEGKNSKPEEGKEQRGTPKDGQKNQQEQAGQCKQGGGQDQKQERGQGKGAEGKENTQQAGQQKQGGQDMQQGQTGSGKEGPKQGSEKKQASGKGEGQKEQRAQGKEAGQERTQQGGAKEGPKDGNPMSQAKVGQSKEGQPKEESQKNETRAGSGKEDRIAGDRKEQKPAEETTRQDAEEAARDLKNPSAQKREEARQRLEEISRDSKDGVAREAAKKELEKEAQGQDAGTARKTPEDKQAEKQAGQSRSADAREQDQKAGSAKSGPPQGKEQQQGQAKQAGGDPTGKEQQAQSKGRAPGEKEARNFEKDAQQAQGKEGDEKQRKEAEERAGQAFKKLLDDLRSEDAQKREEAANALRELARKSREKEDVKKTAREQALPKAVEEAFEGLKKDLDSDNARKREAAEKALKDLEQFNKETRDEKQTPQDKKLEDMLKKLLGGAGQQGTGGKSPQTPTKADPVEEANGAGRHRNQTSDLKLDTFRDRIKKKILNQAGLDEKDLGDIRDLLNRRPDLKAEEGPAKTDGGKALRTTGIGGPIQSGEGKGVQSSNQGLPPLEYRERFSEFSKRFSEAQKKSKDR